MEDLENHIPIYNLAINDRKSEVTIVKKSTNDGLAFTTEYKKVKIKIDVPSGVVVPSVNNRNDIDYICLTVADLLSVYRERHFLKKYELLSLKVFCYGRLVLKQFRTLPSGNSCLTFILNDGTQEITAKYTSSLERNKTNASNKQWLTNEKTKLRRMQNTGINVSGKYLAPETDQCQKILETISNMHQMIANNIAVNSIDYHLGEQAEKALVLGSTFQTSTNEIKLRIWEFSLNDKIEHYWKNSLGKIYRKQ